MKKLYSFLLVAMVAMSSFAADRAHTIKVYNWADYINEDVLYGFPAWYEEQTGEEIELIYQTFDINESMLAQIEKGKEDYDVICPSEYIIDRMLRNGLLQPIPKHLVPAEVNYFNNVAPFAIDKFQQMAPADSDINVFDYAVGYMWGTTGWLYNADKATDKEMMSWGAILDPKFEGKIFMKDAFRDVYSVLVQYAYQEDILAGKVTREELVQEITAERLAAVEDILHRAKNNIAGWEVDFGKEEMTKGNGILNLSWSGDAQWALEEAELVNVNLKYIIPQDGSNVWFDGWCIPVYAQNTKAAAYFISYMCRPDNALANMDEIGYVSVVSTPEILEELTDSTFPPIDVTYFFGEGADSVCVNPVYYPDKSDIERCALMNDAAEHTEEMLAMWNRVKGDNLSMGMVVFLLVVVVLALIIIVMQVMKKRETQKKRNKKRNRR